MNIAHLPDSICSSFIYLSKDAPRFHIGHGTNIGALLLAYVSILTRTRPISFLLQNYCLLRRNGNILSSEQTKGASV